MGTTDQCFKIRWLFKIQKVANPSNFQKFGKNRKKIGWNEVEPWKYQEKFENPKFGRFDRIIDHFNRIIGRFFKKFSYFWKMFWPIKKIWVNLNFNKLNDVVFEKYLHRSA
jgi:hypothetical protein